MFVNFESQMIGLGNSIDCLSTQPWKVNNKKGNFVSTKGLLLIYHLRIANLLKIASYSLPSYLFLKCQYIKQF